MERNYGVFFEITQIQSMLNRIFDSLLEEQAEYNAVSGFAPDVDILETAGELIVSFELPGVDSDELEMIVSDGKVFLEGSKKKKDRSRMRFICMEREFGKFRRIVPLIGAVNPHKARAVLANGILSVRFPRVVDRRGKSIKIDIQEEK